MLSRVTKFDWIKLIGYTGGVLGALTYITLSPILAPFGFSNAKIATIAAVCGGLSTLLANIANVLRNPSSPTGTQPVLTTTTRPTFDSLTTSSAIAAGTGPVIPSKAVPAQAGQAATTVSQPDVGTVADRKTNP
jgi:hypothetical protein